MLEFIPELTRILVDSPSPIGHAHTKVGKQGENVGEPREMIF